MSIPSPQRQGTYGLMKGISFVPSSTNPVRPFLITGRWCVIFCLAAYAAPERVLPRVKPLSLPPSTSRICWRRPQPQPHLPTMLFNTFLHEHLSPYPSEHSEFIILTGSTRYHWQVKTVISTPRLTLIQCI